MGMFQSIIGQFANIRNWTAPEWQAAGKHVLSYAAGATTAAVAIHLLSPADASGITENLNTIWNGVMQVAKGVAGLAAIVVPIYTSLRAAHNASPSEQVKHVVTNLEASKADQAANAIADPKSRTDLINAVSQMPEVKAIVAIAPVALATPSPKVVASPAEIKNGAKTS